VAGLVHNYNTLLGQDGIVGLKTGNTQAAGGCVVLAAWHQAGARRILIVTATFGQPGTAQTSLPSALQAGHMLLLAVDRALDSRQVPKSNGAGPVRQPPTGAPG
jgi:D-alanyl-D-alanine carboxypeptidase (penicillin-binding protein 5/6)